LRNALQEEAMSGSVKVYNWKNIPSRQLRPGLEQRGFRGKNVLVTQNLVSHELVPNPHSHPFEQIFMITGGRIMMHFGDELVECLPGTVVHIPPNVRHWAEPPRKEDGIVTNFDIFSPIRQDYALLADFQKNDYDWSK
jgi:quercetin dioxygenase-like cupin family protein